MTSKIELQSNQKISWLTTIKCLNKKDHRHRILWLFKCDCGNSVKATASDVMLLRKRHCGCKTKEYKKQWGERLRLMNTKPNKMGPFNKLYGNYKRAAIRRNYTWNLSKKRFRELLNQKCSYCGCEPATEICLSSKKLPENTLVYNGIDRKDNTRSYNDTNCITACFTCNRMKMDMSYEKFIGQIKRIYATHESTT
jgi:hypothetical protein